MNALLTRFRSYPMAVQALIILLALVAGGLLWHDFVWRTAQSWNASIDENIKALEEATGRRTSLDAPLQQAIVALGPVAMPGDEEEAVEQLYAAVSEILNKHRVTGHGISQKATVKLPRGTLSTVLDSTQAVERRVYEVKFSAAPDVFINVVADLERSPEIESVRTARVSRSTDPRSPNTLTVNLAVEAWSTTSAGRTGGVR